jgi:hypothetical protein
MLEIFGLFLLGAAIFLGVALVVGLLKLTFKLLILPFTLVGVLFKGVAALIVLPILLLVVLPVALGVGAVLVPLLLLGLALAFVALVGFALCGLVSAVT